MGNALWEFLRCTRHNLLHLKTFRISHSRGIWRVRDGRGVEMVFPYYPYLAFFDIEGYLYENRWRPEPGMTVVDAGGCYGEFALYASKCVGLAGRVLMFEPDPANIAVAEKTFAMNGSPANLQVVPAGLWKSEGKLRFGAGQEAVSAVVTDAADHGNSIEIDVHSLPSLVKQFELKRLDFVKMDIEGAELEVLSRVKDLPTGLRPRYSIASYHLVEGVKTADTIPGLLMASGYRCISGYPQHLTTWATPL